jgi:ubiquinol-cytochrome c reductase cytochrome b subunit
MLAVFNPLVKLAYHLVSVLAAMSHLPVLVRLLYDGRRRWIGPMRTENFWKRWSRRARADHWSILLGEIALCAFVVLVVTGVFLAVFFDPDMTRVAYNGSYRPLRGLPVSKAYDSALRLSFDVRGGLLMRQIHHWAALIFIAAVCFLLIRLFFTGAFRRPRGLNWLIWAILLPLGMVAGWTGTILPDDMLSGGSLGLLQGVLQSIPVVGTHLTLWIFGGDIPGHRIIPRIYWVHVLVVPVAMAGLLALQRSLARRRGHASLPGPGDRPVPARSSAGGTVHDVPAVASVATFFATCAVLTLLGALAQVNPIWLLGPYRPGAITAGAAPDWYMGFLDGALRIMPGWEFEVAGHPVTLAVLVPALIVPGAFFTLLTAYPAIDRRLTGDRGVHHFLDRPRDAATRTAVGAAGITFYGLLWAAAANDQIAYHLQLDLYAVTWFFRLAVFAGPLLAYTITQRICLGLTARDREEAEQGRKTGRIVMSIDGGFSEITEPVRRVPELRA